MMNFNLVGMPKDMASQVSLILNNHWKNSNPFSLRLNIHFNHNQNSILNENEINILLLWEPEAVMPEQYRKKIMQTYDLVIPFNKDRAKRLKLPHFLNHPYDFSMNRERVINPQKMIAFINAKKFSAVSRSMYGFRRKAIIGISGQGIPIEMFGPNWNENSFKEFRERFWAVRRAIKAGRFPDFVEAFSEFGYKYKSYQGSMKEKKDSLPNYRYALVIENDIDSITEKIFEAIECESVPIYIGAPLVDYRDLQKCVIEVSPKISELLEVITELSEDVYNQKVRSIKDFVHLEYQDKIEFSSEHNWKKLACIIDGHLADRLNTNIDSGV